MDLNKLWCQHCISLQKHNDTVVECLYNPLEHGKETAFCAANIDAVTALLKDFQTWLLKQAYRDSSRMLRQTKAYQLWDRVTREYPELSS